MNFEELTNQLNSNFSHKSLIKSLIKSLTIKSLRLEIWNLTFEIPL